MCDFGKRDAFLILQFGLNGLANLVFTFELILYFTASPVCVDLNSEILIFFEIFVYLKSQVMLLIPQQYFKHLLVSHLLQLFIGYVAHQFRS